MGNGMVLRGDRISIRSFSLEDAFKMTEWGTHESPLLYDYNFPYVEGKDIKSWYYSKSSGWNKRYFSIYNEYEHFIGYLGIKQIKYLRKESTLGIVFDPNYLSLGYGTEALKTFMVYYFNNMNMKSLLLDVAKFNSRAIRCYEKCGFKIVGEHLDEFNPDIKINSLRISQFDKFFVIEGEKIYNYIYEMKIDREMFLRGEN